MSLTLSYVYSSFVHSRFKLKPRLLLDWLCEFCFVPHMMWVTVAVMAIGSTGRGAQQSRSCHSDMSRMLRCQHTIVAYIFSSTSTWQRARKTEVRAFLPGHLHPTDWWSCVFSCTDWWIICVACVACVACSRVCSYMLYKCICLWGTDVCKYRTDRILLPGRATSRSCFHFFAMYSV